MHHASTFHVLAESRTRPDTVLVGHEVFQFCVKAIRSRLRQEGTHCTLLNACMCTHSLHSERTLGASSLHAHAICARIIRSSAAPRKPTSSRPSPNPFTAHTTGLSKSMAIVAVQQCVQRLTGALARHKL